MYFVEMIKYSLVSHIEQLDWGTLVTLHAIQKNTYYLRGGNIILSISHLRALYFFRKHHLEGIGHSIHIIVYIVASITHGCLKTIWRQPSQRGIRCTVLQCTVRFREGATEILVLIHNKKLSSEYLNVVAFVQKF